MGVERFRNGDPKSVFRRLKEDGRLIPPGLEYRVRWVARSMDGCFQPVECDQSELLER